MIPPSLGACAHLQSDHNALTSDRSKSVAFSPTASRCSWRIASGLSVALALQFGMLFTVQCGLCASYEYGPMSKLKWLSGGMVLPICGNQDDLLVPLLSFEI